MLLVFVGTGWEEEWGIGRKKGDVGKKREIQRETDTRREIQMDRREGQRD